LAVLLGAGVVHGLWTERWQRSADLALAAQRLQTLPNSIGPWKGEPAELEADALAVAGAQGHWSRTFTNRETGDSVLVVLLCGRAGQMAIHRPEDCYRTAGYELASPPFQVKLQPPGQDAAEFFTGLFTRQEASGPVQLRIFWSWCAGSEWKAPDSPRLTFARAKYLYKLYVVRALDGPQRQLAGDPSVLFLDRLLPQLKRCLTPKDQP
jgi:hypothetical protein